MKMKMNPSLPPRWKGDRDDTRWNSADGLFTYPQTPDEQLSEKPGKIDWLVYRHWRRVPGNQGQARETPITDVCGYDQTRPRRVEDTYQVRDLLLAFRLREARGPGRLFVKATDGREEFRVMIDPHERRFAVFQNGRLLGPGGSGKLPAMIEDMRLEISLFDHQLLLAIDGRPAVTHPYELSGRPPRPTARPVSIGSQGLGVAIGDLRLYRDVYYTHPPGRLGRWGLSEPVRLGPDEYYVLGDNSPISEDSRTWTTGPAVAEKLLIGKPLVVHFPARHVKLGGWHIQVPDPGKIRYIR